MISRLCSDLNARASYIKAKVGVIVPSQIRALRLKSNMPRQADLAREADMQQSRISMFETPGAANMTVETLCRLAATFRVGLAIKFVSFSEMLEWENSFAQDSFNVIKIENDREFFGGVRTAKRSRKKRPRAFGKFAQHTGAVQPWSVETYPVSTQAQQLVLSFDLRRSIGSVVPINVKEQTESGLTSKPWKNLAMIGGIDDARQGYCFASTPATEERAFG